MKSGGGRGATFFSRGSGGMSPRKFWYFRALRQLLVQPVAKILIELLNNLLYTKYRLGAVADIKSFLDLGCKHVQKVGGGQFPPPPPPH